MLTGDELINTLVTLPVLSEEGVAYRLIHARYAGNALSSIGSLKFGGRYNPPQTFKALYLASNPVTALQEVNALVQTASGLLGVKGPPRILLFVEYKLIRKLVELQIISNWQIQDTPQHLRTIGDRILRSKDKTVRLLSLYQKILEKEEIPADDSPEQIELRLSGLVVKRSNSLRVYNPIYQKVFDLNWVKRELDNVRPYLCMILTP